MSSSSVLLSASFVLLLFSQLFYLINADNLVYPNCTSPDPSTLPLQLLSFKLLSLTQPFEPRYLHSTPVLNDGTTLIIGGARIISTLPRGSSTSAYKILDVWKSVDNGISWQLVNPAVPFVSRWGHTADAIGSTVLLIGGIDLDRIYYNEIWSSVDKGLHWYQQAQAPFSKRFAHSSCVDPNSNLLIISGGFNYKYQFTNDVFYSKDVGVEWNRATDSAAFQPRMFHTTVVRQSVFYITGGQ